MHDTLPFPLINFIFPLTLNNMQRRDTILNSVIKLFARNTPSGNKCPSLRTAKTSRTSKLCSVFLHLPVIHLFEATEIAERCSLGKRKEILEKEEKFYAGTVSKF